MTATAKPEVEIQADEGSATILAQPLVTFGPEITGDVTAALRREWLVTNGLGGYASGTLYTDILRAAVEPSWDEIGRLAAIAAIRTALNYFLQREIARDARMTSHDSEAAQIVSGAHTRLDGQPRSAAHATVS